MPAHIVKDPISYNELFENENKLPSLPVPSLDSTLIKLQTALKPLLNDEQFNELSVKINEFK